MTHIKPTKEELQARIEKDKKDLEALEKGAQPSPSAAPSPSPSKSATSPSPSAGVSASPSPTPSTPAPSGSVSASPSPSAAPEDEKEKLKKKATASAREAQVLHSRTAKYDKAVEDAEKVEPPTEKEMEEKYGKDEWDDMSEGHKQMARDSWVSNKRFEIMSAASKEGRDIQAWNDKVDTFITDPKTLNKYQDLEGKTEEFKEFAMKPSRRGLDMDDLVLAFKGELSTNPPKQHKGKQMEQGSHGHKRDNKPNDGKISLEESRTLKKTNYNEWRRLLQAGKIRES